MVSLAPELHYHPFNALRYCIAKNHSTDYLPKKYSIHDKPSNFRTQNI